MTINNDTTRMLVRRLDRTVMVIEALLKKGTSTSTDSLIKYKLEKLEELVDTIPEANSTLLTEWQEKMVALWLDHASCCSDDADQQDFKTSPSKLEDDCDKVAQTKKQQDQMKTQQAQVSDIYTPLPRKSDDDRDKVAQTKTQQEVQMKAQQAQTFTTTTPSPSKSEDEQANFAQKEAQIKAQIFTTKTSSVSNTKKDFGSQSYLNIPDEEIDWAAKPPHKAAQPKARQEAQMKTQKPQAMFDTFSSSSPYSSSSQPQPNKPHSQEMPIFAPSQKAIPLPWKPETWFLSSNNGSFSDTSRDSSINRDQVVRKQSSGNPFWDKCAQNKMSAKTSTTATTHNDGDRSGHSSRDSSCHSGGYGRQSNYNSYNGGNIDNKTTYGSSGAATVLPNPKAQQMMPPSPLAQVAQESSYRSPVAPSRNIEPDFGFTDWGAPPS